jgi:uncharacterized membrane protein
MDWQLILGIIFRWVHVSAAATVVGAIFFARVVVPGSLAQLDEPSAQTALLKMRRGLKLIVHVCITLFLISGIYNVVTGWPKYSKPGVAPLGQMLIGTHMLLALVVIVLALLILSGPQPPRWARKAMTVSLLLLFLTIAAASSVKWICDHPRQSAVSTARGH